MLKDVLCILVDELKKDNIKETLEKELLSPVVDKILCRIQPYILATCVFLIVLFCVAVTTLFFVVMYLVHA